MVMSGESANFVGMEARKETSIEEAPTTEAGSVAERRLTLRKSAKLRHRSLVEGLFAEGKGMYEHPLRLKWRVLRPGELEGVFRYGVPDRIGPVQMLVTIPKKKRRRAVDRVLMRRRVREAFRLNSGDLRERVAADPNIRTLSLAFIYGSDSNVDYAEVERRLCRLLRKLTSRLWPESGSSD